MNERFNDISVQPKDIRAKETGGHAGTSSTLRLGDILMGADSDRSGMTSAVIGMVRQDQKLRDSILTPASPSHVPWTTQEVEAVMGSDRIHMISKETGQTPDAIEKALCDILPMIGTALVRNELPKV